AASEELKEAIEEHLAQTQNHVSRLEEIFGELQIAPKGKSCKAMKGLIEEGGEAATENAPEAIADLSIIAAAQRVEHYEISAYGTARAIASHLGHEKIASLLEETEDEEKSADSKLTEVAMTLYDETANEAGGEGETQPRRKATSAEGASTPR